ncbi:hypothetical protein D3C87_1346720 [compost metagenome]
MAADNRFFLLCAPGMQVGIGHFVEGCQCRCAGDGIAGVSATESALGQIVEQRLAPDHRTQRHAAGDAFAEQDQVRLDAQPRECEALAGTAETGLDFIGDQHNALVVAELAQRLGELDLHGQEARFALHRFDDKTGDVFDINLDAEQALHGFAGFGAGDAVVLAGEGQVKHRPRQHADFLLVGSDFAVEVEGGQCAAVESAVEGDDRAAAGGATDDLQGVFRRFRAAVGEHAADRVTHRHECAEAIHQFEVRLMGRSVERVVGQTGGLFANGFDDARMAMAEVEYADATDEVDVAFAIGVPDLGVFAVAERDRVNDVDRLADGFAAHE